MKSVKKWLSLEIMLIVMIFSILPSIAGAFPYRVLSEPKSTTTETETFTDMGSVFLDSVPNYSLDKLAEYQNFAGLHPEFDLSEIVWRVNAGLNRPFYDGIFQYPSDFVNPLLVNKYYKLPPQFRPSKLVNLFGGQQVTPETKAAFDEMAMDAADEGQTLALRSAYRSIGDQAYIYKQYLKTDSQETVDTYSARSGHSEHHTGRAIDLCGVLNRDFSAFEKTSESLWINENAWKYGFIVRYPIGAGDITGYKYEPWHITYVGREIASFMHEHEILTLEEYVFKWLGGTLIDLK